MRARAVFAAMLIAACSTSSTDVPDETPLVDGVVSQIEASRVLIEADVTRCERFWLAVDAKTRVLQAIASGAARTASFGDIRVGQNAVAWSDDPVAESCPAQGHADVILLRR